MKKILLILFIFFSFWFLSTNALWDIWWTSSDKVIYCQWGECSLDNWTKIVKNWIETIEKNKTASEFIKSVVRYLLSFVSLIAVLYIIYAWFNLVIGGWNEEKNKKAKTTVVSIIVWIILMWLAYSIVLWLMNVIKGI
jgi:hypothetical protein